MRNDWKRTSPDGTLNTHFGRTIHDCRVYVLVPQGATIAEQSQRLVYLDHTITGTTVGGCIPSCPGMDPDDWADAYAQRLRQFGQDVVALREILSATQSVAA